jgi:hypothetical protein
VILRCVVDGLLLPAELSHNSTALIAYDGEEGFCLEAIEALFYEVVSATFDEIVSLQRAGYRLMRLAEDFTTTGSPSSADAA